MGITWVFQRNRSRKSNEETENNNYLNIDDDKIDALVINISSYS